MNSPSSATKNLIYTAIKQHVRIVSLQRLNESAFSMIVSSPLRKKDSTARTDYKAKLPVCKLNVMIHRIQISRDPFESCVKLGIKLEKVSVATPGMAWQNRQKRARRVSTAGSFKGGVIGVKYQT